MTETVITYFLDGVETTKEQIDWNRSSSIRCKNNNEMHIQYMDGKKNTPIDDVPINTTEVVMETNSVGEVKSSYIVTKVKAEPKKGLSTRAKASDICPKGILINSEDEKFIESPWGKLTNSIGLPLINLSKEEDKFNISAGSFEIEDLDEEQSTINLLKGFVEVTKYISDQWEKDKQTLQKNYDESTEPTLGYYNNKGETVSEPYSEFEKKHPLQEARKIITSHTNGVKETEGKLDYSEINFKLLDLMANRFAANKHKYPKGNSKKGIDQEEILWAAFRHIRKMIQPIEGDVETFEEHLAAVATNMSIILDQLELKNNHE